MTLSVESAAAAGIERARARPRRVLPLVERALADQQELSAVERFARTHDELPETARAYAALIPLSRPRAGEQYAFHVDLDACTGCKACVAACHRLNGLDEGESFRAVGALSGGTAAEPTIVTVTGACHHCVEPACLAGCPVNAYEKDPETGIVRHLDDQCIGCQYCTLTCPYDVPRFNKKLGIVRKCDLCEGRLAAGEAPACVQACPNQAISIRVVESRQVIEDAQADAFLPATPAPGLTLPTTLYSTRRALPKNLLPADFWSVRRGARHLPLVVMLVLTQLSVGVLAVDLAVEAGLARALPLRPEQALVAALAGLLALGASTLHLGRPLYAFRAVLGLGRSWLSREIVAFSAFAACTIGYAASFWLPAGQALTTHLQQLSGTVAVSIGLFGVLCSAMVYHVTRRRSWSGGATTFKFLATALVLGLATTLVRLIASGANGNVSDVARTLAFALAAASATKLAVELAILGHLGDRRQSELRRTAILVVTELRLESMLRIGLGLVGGVTLPLALARGLDRGGGALPDSTFPVLLALLSAMLLLAGELLERDLFFASQSSPRMPGSLD